jgi:hypothetical protein
MPTALSNNLIIKTVPEKNGPDKYLLSKMNVVHTLCFATKKSEGTLIGMFGETYACEDSSLSAKANAVRRGIPKILQVEPGNPALSIRIRSNRDIYNYLGALLIAQTRTNNPVTVSLTPSYVSPGTLTVEKLPLVVINKGRPTGRVLAEIDYRGDSFYIPATDNGYSPQVVNILAQLLNLNKIPGTIPPSPAVLIR